MSNTELIPDDMGEYATARAMVAADFMSTATSHCWSDCGLEKLKGRAEVEFRWPSSDALIQKLRCRLIEVNQIDT